MGIVLSCNGKKQLPYISLKILGIVKTLAAECTHRHTAGQLRIPLKREQKLLQQTVVFPAIRRHFHAVPHLSTYSIPPCRDPWNGIVFQLLHDDVCNLFCLFSRMHSVGAFIALFDPFQIQHNAGENALLSRPFQTHQSLLLQLPCRSIVCIPNHRIFVLILRQFPFINAQHYPASGNIRFGKMLAVFKLIQQPVQDHLRFLHSASPFQRE